MDWIKSKTEIHENVHLFKNWLIVFVKETVEVKTNVAIKNTGDILRLQK